MQKSALLILVLGPLAGMARGENWPGWRGPTGDGVSRETGLPTHWSDSENVAWKTSVPGVGQSSPIVWGDRVYVTAATGPRYRTQWWIYCFNRDDGTLRWKTLAAEGRAERAHSKHGHASSTPGADGERIWAYFGAGGAVCLDRDGAVLWRRKLRDYVNPWGVGGSVLLFGDRVFINCDDDRDAFLVALDRSTGDVAWRAERPGQMRSFSTPVAVPVADGDRSEIVLNGQNRVAAYDPQTGKELWTVEGMTRWVTPTPVVYDGLVFASSGRSGPTFAIRPGGRGDVIDTHIVWRVMTGSPYISSAVAWNARLYMVNGQGICRCLKVRDGREVWKARLASGGVDGYSNSPVAADGRIYVMDEAGGCTILKAGDQFETLARNELHERCLASPAISDGQIFIRTDARLYCIGRRRTQGESAASQ